MEKIIREVRYPKGKIEKLEVPMSKINADINKLIKDNKDLFEILARL
ncbi:MAG: hypothetical protein GF368_00840 [Candidatus Aenigmarchaeota archaeon]|nr:hypothetical protein [Candidatus Aenigmarchaeota archaeon]